ncbi:hypothetical protein D8872_09430 [Streptococcus cristatus]|uniref:Uncharacterized protein n=1 Tax=Streptococcus cristatus TaxID=45634 RepID=A0A428AHA1_STRCR|nr:hypothetical protein D8872_09430 [Streptococcus cristatus]
MPIASGIEVSLPFLQQKTFFTKSSLLTYQVYM